MNSSRHVTVAGRSIRESTHICAFFDSSRAQYAVAVPFFREGLANGERIVTLCEAEKLPAHVSRLERSGVPMKRAISGRQVKVMSSEDTYLRGGRFEVERTLEVIEDALFDAEHDRFRGLRTWGDMGWALRNLEGTGQLMEYESRLNLLTEAHDCTLLCVYDLNRFGARVLMDILCTHPKVLMGDTLLENPYYIPPAEFLHRLRHPHSASLAREGALN
jgi:hypothetical protein